MENPEPTTTTGRCRRRGRLLVLGLAAVVAGAAGLAWATGHGPAAFAHHFGGGAACRDMAELHVHRALAQVDASAAQEQQILAILDAQIEKHQGMAAVHEELHSRLVAALAGPTVDRAALEAVRADAIARVDAGSRELVQALANAAEVLTPEQRQRLAELAVKRFE